MEKLDINTLIGFNPHLNKDEVYKSVERAEKNKANKKNKVIQWFRLIRNTLSQIINGMKLTNSDLITEQL